MIYILWLLLLPENRPTLYAMSAGYLANLAIMYYCSVTTELQVSFTWMVTGLTLAFLGALLTFEIIIRMSL